MFELAHEMHACHCVNVIREGELTREKKVLLHVGYYRYINPGSPNSSTTATDARRAKAARRANCPCGGRPATDAVSIEECVLFWVCVHVHGPYSSQSPILLSSRGSMAHQRLHGPVTQYGPSTITRSSDIWPSCIASSPL